LAGDDSFTIQFVDVLVTGVRHTVRVVTNIAPMHDLAFGGSASLKITDRRQFSIPCQPRGAYRC